MNKIEAILFSVGKKIDIAEIAKLCRIKDFRVVRKELIKIQHEYDRRHSPMMVVEEGTSWKLIVREKYLLLVRKIVADTELPKTVMETLAVIAWRYPILQSEVINIRTNKAYDHIKELEKMGFLVKIREGRTYRIKLSQKFFDYFDLKDRSDIQKVFKKIKDLPPTPLKPNADHLDSLEVYKTEEIKLKKAPEPSVGDLEVYENKDKEEPEVTVKEESEEIETQEGAEGQDAQVVEESEPKEDESEDSTEQQQNDEDKEEPTEDEVKEEDEPEQTEEDNERELSPELEHMLEEGKPKKDDHSES